MIRLFLLYAILIFAKKAPQLIKDLLNIKGDNIGLKGLSIKNKMGEAALVGKHVKKGMTGIEGGIKKGIGGAAGGFKGGFAKGFANAKGKSLKERLAAGVKSGANGMGKGFTGGIISGTREAAARGDTKGMLTGSYKDTREIASDGRPTFWNKKIKQPIQGILSGIESHGFNSVEIQRKKDADVLKRRVVSMLGTKEGNKLLSKLSVDYNNPASYSKYIDSLKSITKTTDGTWKDPAGNVGTLPVAFGNIPSEYQIQNIHAARKKALTKFQNLNSQLVDAVQSGDTALADNIQQQMLKVVYDNQNLFKDNPNNPILKNLGIEEINFGSGPISYNQQNNTYSGNCDDLRISVSTEIAKNASALSDADNMVKAVEEKPKPAGDK